MAFLEINQVDKIFKDAKRGTQVQALQDISVTIEENEFVCLLGGSGCGKSTLLNLIAGFEKPTIGEIMMNGKKIEKMGADRGMVFQQPTLMPWLTVQKNIAFHLKLKRASRQKKKEEAQKYIDMVGLTGFEKHYPHELSGGMSQRVGIARALLQNPSLILMDEPFAALDPFTKLEMQEELARIWQKNKRTIIFVTHSVEEALMLGTKVIVLSKRPGRINKIINLEMDRPRDSTSPIFNRYKREILTLIEKNEEPLLEEDSMHQVI
ncbi:ABC transporter ATP-binding protein [Gracilibacillus alcaliphilus]|uniref:ABC transporter ATP-binding protein n=1 Tax=Gracilibacillus alcaliphilus TaxID=1401441 RepID=UPI00195CBA85|nr:ABC transporter ATP-binding protein [Gracilibacillus alcaliphilus]MBM7677516.1 NitT/TauT family transport system ATP-binding protein [Gracilibacillus alcaliphilus]